MPYFEANSRRIDAQITVPLGFATFCGYLSLTRGRPASARVTYQSRRPHAKATSGDVQSGAGPAPHRQRSNRRATQLPVVQRFHRAFARSFSTAAPLSRDPQVYCLRSHGSIYRGRGVTSVAGNCSFQLARPAHHPDARIFCPVRSDRCLTFHDLARSAGAVRGEVRSTIRPVGEADLVQSTGLQVPRRGRPGRVRNCSGPEGSAGRSRHEGHVTKATSRRPRHDDMRVVCVARKYLEDSRIFAGASTVPEFRNRISPARCAL